MKKDRRKFVERRKFVRLSAKVTVRYKILEKGHRQRKKTESKNISGGGIRLHLNEQLSEGTPLELEIKIPSEARIILAEGRVVWSKEIGTPGSKGKEGVQWFDAGIMFTKIDSTDRCKILKYVYDNIY